MTNQHTVHGLFALVSSASLMCSYETGYQHFLDETRHAMQVYSKKTSQTLLWSASIPKSEHLCSTNMSYSTKESGSKSSSILSRAVNLPCNKRRFMVRVTYFHCFPHVDKFVQLFNYFKFRNSNESSTCPLVLSINSLLTSSNKGCASFLFNALLNSKMANGIISWLQQEIWCGGCNCSMLHLCQGLKWDFQTIQQPTGAAYSCERRHCHLAHKPRCRTKLVITDEANHI